MVFTSGLYAESNTSAFTAFIPTTHLTIPWWESKYMSSPHIEITRFPRMFLLLYPDSPPYNIILGSWHEFNWHFKNIFYSATVPVMSPINPSPQRHMMTSLKWSHIGSCLVLLVRLQWGLTGSASGSVASLSWVFNGDFSSSFCLTCWTGGLIRIPMSSRRLNQPKIHF